MTAAAPTRVGVVACGALAVHVRAIAKRRGWALDVHPLDATLHNRPERIAPAVSELLATLRPRYAALAAPTPAASRKASARSVRSQVKSSCSRPKWP